MTENFDGSPASPASIPHSPQTEKSVPKLAAALAKAQGKIAAPLKRRKVDFLDNKNRRVHYNYADLADVIDCIRKPLKEHGLAILHKLGYSPSGQMYGMTTILMHESGEFESAWYPLPDPLNGEIRPQEFGSALTYARRYSLTALLGIASEEDDDGQSAAPAGKEKKAAPKSSSAAAQKSPVTPKGSQGTDSTGPGSLPGFNSTVEAPKAPSVDQIGRLFAIAKAREWTEENVRAIMETAFSVTSTKNLSIDQYDLLVDTIQKKSFGQASASAIAQRTKKAV